jgi:hypothetical protein
MTPYGPRLGRSSSCESFEEDGKWPASHRSARCAQQYEKSGPSILQCNGAVARLTVTPPVRSTAVAAVPVGFLLIPPTTGHNSSFPKASRIIGALFHEADSARSLFPMVNEYQ